MRNIGPGPSIHRVREPVGAAPALAGRRADTYAPASSPKGNVMDLDFSPEDLTFRSEARTFIAENYPKALREKQKSEDALTKEDYFSWHRILAKKGWSAPSWPKEWGGTGWTPTQKYIWSEEQAKADTIGILPFGVAMLAPVIYTF